MDTTIRGKGHGRVNQVTDKRKQHRHLVADAVNEQAEHNDADAKRPDPRPLQFADRNLVQAEIRDKLAAAKNHAADECVGSGDQGNETAPKQNLIVPVFHGEWNAVLLPNSRQLSMVNANLSTSWMAGKVAATLQTCGADM